MLGPVMDVAPLAERPEIPLVIMTALSSRCAVAR
jgi:hypothetical protein